MDTEINTDPSTIITITTTSNTIPMSTPTSVTTSSNSLPMSTPTSITTSSSTTMTTANLPKWSSDTSPISVIPCTEFVGPKVPLPHTFLDIFRLLFTTSLLELITQQTNLYAKHCLSDDNYEKFVPITTNELEAFLGFMILMGINQLPSI